MIENKKAIMYIIWSNLYLPLFLLYLIIQDKYLDFLDASKALPYMYILIFTELLNAAHFKIAFGPSQSHNKKFIQGILSRMSNLKISEILQTTIAVISAVLAFGFLAIIFGASIMSNHEQTLIFSSLLAILTVLPACVHFNAQSAISLLTSGQYSNNFHLNEQKIILQKFYCTMLGAWLGAFVIPLDWSRDWQAWPIPCCIGALVGTSAGQLATIVHLNDVMHQFKSGPGLFGKTTKRTR